MSWTDDFTGTLDTAKFGTSVAGDGAVAVSGGTLNITEGAAVSNAVIVYLKDVLSPTSDYSYQIRHKVDGTMASGVVRLFDVHNGIPAVGGAATVNPNLRIYCYMSLGSLYVAYKDSGGTIQYWRQSDQTWGTTAYGVPVSISSYVDVVFISFNGAWNFDIRVGGGTRAVIQTTPIAFSALNSYSFLYALWGDTYTDYYYTTSMKTESVIFSDGEVQYAYHNGQAGASYKCGRAISFDGSSFFANPVTPIISPASGESDVKDVFTVYDSATGTLHLFYAALRNASPYGFKWRVRWMTSTDFGINLTDHGYITTPGGAGTWNENGDRFPAAIKVGSTWHVYVGGESGSNVYSVGYYSGTDLTALSAYGSNPIISAGSGGAWNDGGVLPSDLTYDGGTLALYVGGLKASTSRWQGGIWTSTDWVTFAPDSGNPVLVHDLTRSTTLTGGGPPPGTTQLTVASSAMFAVDEPIFIHDATALNQETNRISSIPDGTHINLYYPTKNSYNIGDSGVNAYDSGSLFWGETDAVRGIVTPFQLYDSAHSAPFIETTGWWDYTGGAWVMNAAKTPVLPLGPTWNTISTENFRLITTAVVPPNAVTNLSAARNGETQIDVTWTDNATTETAYYIDRKVDGGAWTTLDHTLAAGTQAYSDTDVTTGHSYQYRVSPYNGITNWVESSVIPAAGGFFLLDGFYSPLLRGALCQ